MNYCADFGKRLREARVLSGMKQPALADKIGISSQMISAYENGKRSPSIEVAAALAKELNVSLDYLCGLESNESNNMEISSYGAAIQYLSKLSQYFDCTCEVVVRPLPEDECEEFEAFPGHFEVIDSYKEVVISIDDPALESFIGRWTEMESIHRKMIISDEIMDSWYSGEIERAKTYELTPRDKRNTRWFGIRPERKSKQKD